MTQIHQRRFNELASQLEELEASKTPYRSAYAQQGQVTVDGNKLLEWKVKVRNLLSIVCGPESEHLSQFTENESAPYGTKHDVLQQLAAVFRAAKEDFEGGYLSSLRSIVQAELFDSELEQARELLKKGFILPAAVVAGVVLETTLRELSDRHSISQGKVDRMNSDLAKAGVYNRLVQKRITALADIRNSAAHGRTDEFTSADVQDMIRDVERFVGEQLK